MINQWFLSIKSRRHKKGTIPTSYAYLHTQTASFMMTAQLQLHRLNGDLHLTCQTQNTTSTQLKMSYLHDMPKVVHQELGFKTLQEVEVVIRKSLKQTKALPGSDYLRRARRISHPWPETTAWRRHGSLTLDHLGFDWNLWEKGHLPKKMILILVIDSNWIGLFAVSNIVIHGWTTPSENLWGITVVVSWSARQKSLGCSWDKFLKTNLEWCSNINIYVTYKIL